MPTLLFYKLANLADENVRSLLLLCTNINSNIIHYRKLRFIHLCQYICWQRVVDGHYRIYKPSDLTLTRLIY
jgi:hypothetical protein